MSTVLHQIQALEVELHHPGVGVNVERLAQLLHPEFYEVGRSGRTYNRETVVKFLGAHECKPAVVSEAFGVSEIAPGVAILTYRSAQIGHGKILVNHTLRSSLWLKESKGWQLRYHQGTPSAEIW